MAWREISNEGKGRDEKRRERQNKTSESASDNSERGSKA